MVISRPSIFPYNLFYFNPSDDYLYLFFHTSLLHFSVLADDFLFYSSEKIETTKNDLPFLLPETNPIKFFYAYTYLLLPYFV